MPVAKTYEKMALQGEPFQENGRMYVNVLTPKGIKKVRWYTINEYKRMYPDAVVEDDIMNFNAKHAFGFDDTGYITLYKGKNVEEWADEDRTNIYYNLTFGFYTPGRLTLPKMCDGIEPVQLKWEDVMDHDDRMRPHEEVKSYVDKLLILDDTGKSQYQGIENEWLQKEIKVTAKKSQDGRFGTKHTYTLEDAQNNLYVWETGAKNYSLNQTISLKMKVKEHKEINGNQVTVVWYCKEV